jgi:hypothetical protein
MKQRPARNGKQRVQARLNTLAAAFRQATAAGNFEEALSHATAAARLAPSLPVPRTDMAFCMVKLRRWAEAVEHAKAALKLGPPTLAALDALAHASGELGQWDEVRVWGLKALEARAAKFGGPAPIAHQAAPLPPPPSPGTREQNVIAFSLFGAEPKYCETAVLNVEERARFYPDWTCHFYVDETVPGQVIKRLLVPGSRVYRVDETERQWPGPMWRLIACDEPGLHRVIFRDADSVINAREAGAVADWVASGTRFHHMRDGASHTELMLAGLWGCTGGALPPIKDLVARFLEKPLASRHFADQYFLREFVWPYARASLIQHDSLFGFLDHRSFPEGPRRDDFHVGCAEGASRIGMATGLPDGAALRWTLYRQGPRPEPVCSYPGVSRNDRVIVDLPSRWARALVAGDMLIRIEPA